MTCRGKPWSAKAGTDSPSDASTGAFCTLAKLTRDVSAAAREEGAALAILIDEAQDLTLDEFTAVCSTAHLASQQERPVLIALAGLERNGRTPRPVHRSLPWISAVGARP